MHVYIYDSFLNQKKYNSLLSKIEIRITDLGLNGKIARLGLMKNIHQTIENEVKRGAKTIVVVGNDHIVNEAINIMAGKRIPLGVIPVDEGPNLISKNLGVGSIEKACDTLSARRIEKLDVIAINNYCLLSEASITTDGTVVEIDQNYSIEANVAGEIRIINMALKKEGLPECASFNPQDGVFELLIETKQKNKGFLLKLKNGQSIFPLKHLNLSNLKNYPIVVGGIKELPLPAEVRIIERGVSMIVGKDRMF